MTAPAVEKRARYRRAEPAYDPGDRRAQVESGRHGYEPGMHNENVERPGDDDAGDLRRSVEAADDTGLIRQQEVLTVAELGDAPVDEREGGA